MRQVWIRHAGAAAALAALSACGAPPEEPPSPALAREQAAEEARTHLPFFLERLALKDASDRDFQMTIVLPAEGRSLPRAELVIKDIVWRGSSFHGVIAKADKNWPEFELGETMMFPASIVSDWTFNHKSVRVGGFQTRAQLCAQAQIPGEESEALQKRLQAELSAAGDARLKPADACKPVDPRKQFEAAGKRK